MVKLGQSYYYQSRLADSSMPSHRGEKLEDSGDLEDCMSRTPRYGDSQRFLATADSENLLRSQIYGSALEICYRVSCWKPVSKSETWWEVE